MLVYVTKFFFIVPELYTISREQFLLIQSLNSSESTVHERDFNYDAPGVFAATRRHLLSAALCRLIADNMLLTPFDLVAGRLFSTLKPCKSTWRLSLRLFIHLARLIHLFWQDKIIRLEWSVNVYLGKSSI